jgi:outer membrane protein assembly factor BamB
MKRRLSRLISLLVLVALWMSGCGGGTTTGETAPRGGAPAAGAWTTYGGSGSRASVAPGARRSPGLQRRFSRSVDGEVYAQPLIAGGRIYVATENNSVYAFTTGGKLVWKHNLGAPVPGSDLPCGNISPSGITGTPVIAGGRIFAVAFLRASHTHVLFGLDLADGRVAVRADVDPPDPTVHQQRGALLASSGRVYVPYGGLFGDCGPYRGYVISTTENGGGRLAYENPATQAGIWAPAGISEQSWTLLVSTGNGGGSTFAYQNSVIRLSRGLSRIGYWAPADWRPLSAGDVDEGSLAPLPVSGGRVFQIGKDGVGYLLPHALGGIGGQQFSAHVCSGGAFGADAFRAPLAVVPCGSSLYGITIESTRFRIIWTSSAGGRVPVIAGDSVFALTGDGTLNQLRIADGHLITSTNVGAGATSFPAPAAAGSTLVAPAGPGIVVFSI